MRTKNKILILSPLAVVLGCGLLLFVGVLSTPRDFSSPPTGIRVVDQSGSPMRDIEVSRKWIDSDCLKDGSEVMATDQTGTAQFAKIPANVDLLTGAWRKTYSHFGICGSGSGTETEIYVRFQGRYDVLPQGKPLHAVGQHGARQDSDGVWFSSDLDSRSNTVVSLTFSPKAKSIYYVLSAKRAAP